MQNQGERLVMRAVENDQYTSMINEHIPKDLPESPLPPPDKLLSIDTIEIDGAIYDIILILWTSNGFVGHCTNTYHICPCGTPPLLNNQELDKYDFVVKDAWLEKDLVNHEDRKSVV